MRPNAETADSLARDIDALLHDVVQRRRLQRDAAGWMQVRAWPPIARRLTGLLGGLALSRDGRE